MSVDACAFERRLKPAKRTAADLVPLGARVLLDTCVYIDASADRLPDAIAALLPRRFHHHSSVCLAELTAAIGELDPTDRRTPGNRATIEAIIARIDDDERMMVPDDNAWAMAGMLAGMLKRAQRYDAEQRRKALADCLVFVSALRFGLILLTANLAEFDLLHQLFPEARVAFYRAE